MPATFGAAALSSRAPSIADPRSRASSSGSAAARRRRVVVVRAAGAAKKKPPNDSPCAVTPYGLERTANVGILGGGQLGRMLAIAAAPMGVRLRALDPNPVAPASVAAVATEGSFQSRDDVLAFASDCDVVTVEIEHIDVAALEELEAMGVDVQPTSRTLAIIQDKFRQKEHFAAAGVPLGEFRSIADDA